MNVSLMDRQSHRSREVFVTQFTGELLPVDAHHVPPVAGVVF